jgi:hypothetical protein
MKMLLLLCAVTTVLMADAAPQLNDQFGESSKCKPCHAEKVKEWSGSWHAKSHYNSDEYLRKSMDYVGRKSRKSLNAIKVQCAACHNPRIAVTKTGIEYEIQSVMKLDSLTEVNKALESDSLNEGINCLVCHNVDKIDDKADETVRGVHRLKWNRVGMMSGPLDDARSPYHKTQSRDFFTKKPDRLCFVCHANDRSEEGLVFADTEKEMQKSDKMCVDCHMSPQKMGFASNLPIDNNKPKKRMVREHGFVGAHTEWLWEGALSLTVLKKEGKLFITMTNGNPHNIPTGFGARELILDVEYKLGSKTIKQEQISLTQHYTDKRGNITIPHLGVQSTKDISVSAYGSKTVALTPPENAGSASVVLSYRLVNDEVRNLLDLEDEIWSKKMLIDRVNYRF